MLSHTHIHLYTLIHTLTCFYPPPHSHTSSLTLIYTHTHTHVWWWRLRLQQRCNHRKWESSRDSALARSGLRKHTERNMAGLCQVPIKACLRDLPTGPQEAAALRHMNVHRGEQQVHKTHSEDGLVHTVMTCAHQGPTPDYLCPFCRLFSVKCQDIRAEFHSSQTPELSTN